MQRERNESWSKIIILHSLAHLWEGSKHSLPEPENTWPSGVAESLRAMLWLRCKKELKDAAFEKSFLFSVGLIGGSAVRGQVSVVVLIGSMAGEVTGWCDT